MVASALSTRLGAESEASKLPALQVAAEQLASTVMVGVHGRRRAGMGEEFWQYRHHRAGDEPRMIDWRRSAKSSDTRFVRELEWQTAQSVSMWVDPAASMRFASKGNPTKSERAQLLGLALAIIMLRGGERVGLTDGGTVPRAGMGQLTRIAAALSKAELDVDFSAPDARHLAAHSTAVLISDFLGDFAAIEAAVSEAASRGVRGVLIQTLDLQEEVFPFKGRTIFESITGALRHETKRAGDLRDRYLERLAARKVALSGLAKAAGWQFHTHHTDQSPQQALLWAYQALGRT